MVWRQKDRHWQMHIGTSAVGGFAVVSGGDPDAQPSSRLNNARVVGLDSGLLINTGSVACWRRIRPMWTAEAEAGLILWRLLKAHANPLVVSQALAAAPATFVPFGLFCSGLSKGEK